VFSGTLKTVLSLKWVGD